MGDNRPGGRAPATLQLNPTVLVAGVQPLVPAWRLDRTFDYAVPEEMVERVSIGTLVRVPLGARKVRGVVRSLSETTSPGSLEPLASVVIRHPIAPPPHDRLLELVAERYAVPMGRVFDRAVPPRVRVKVDERERPPGHASSLPSGYDGLDRLAEAITEGSEGFWVLEASPLDDRSALISALLAARPGGSALVAVPEVRYATRMLDGLAAQDPSSVRVDSAVPPPERAAGMVSLAGAQGRDLVGLGGRSATLCAVADLRLIVIDDEHHPALKEDRSPRYDSRWVARARAELEGATCVFISCTPTLEATYRAQTSGTYVRPNRDKRRAGRPIVVLADVPESALSKELHEGVRATLREGGRVALLVPGSGFARIMWCAGCRRSMRCPRCEGAVSYDAGPAIVRCPRCGSQGPAPTTCPFCGAAEFRYLGAGSQRVASQIERMFPRARVVRVDPSNFSATTDVDADIYVTTWIGTKPEIRPRVNLVGVLDADWLIHRPDLRSTERAYHALSAMAAWAGPAGAGGRMVIQTAEPGHHCVQAVVRGDHDFFARRELEIRKELGYPPFLELVKVRFGGKNPAELIEEVRSVLGPSDRILGPISVRSADGAEASEILIKTLDAQRVAGALRVILPRVPKGDQMRVDVDPR